MRFPQVRFTLQRAMLGIVVISVLLGVASWARSNILILYEEIPTRSGPLNIGHTMPTGHSGKMMESRAVG